MQEVGLCAVPLPVGSGSASTSSGHMAPITTKGIASAQAPSLLSRGGASTSVGQAISLPSRGGGSAFQVASNTPRAVASTSGFQEVVTTSRHRFHVELKEGETNVVSWKKLLKDAQRNASSVVAEVPAGANPALEARFIPERAVLAQASMVAAQEPLPPPPNRFSSVIEKIERLYKGVDSDEEDAGASVDDSQYDSKDGFIDDTELDEYFSVDKAKTKHTGFFVNRGKLEKVNELPPPPPVHVPRKRKRKDATVVSGETVTEEFAKKRVNTGLRLKDAARKTPVPCITAGVEATPTLLRSSAEQALVSKPKKRVKPILDDRDNDIEPDPVLNHDCASEENLRDNVKADEIKKDLDRKMQTTVVELSDDDNDALEVVKPESDAKGRGSADVALTKRQAKAHMERIEASDEETNHTNKSGKASVDEKAVKDVQKESKSPVTLSKAKKNQQVIRDEESRETDGTGKTPSAILTSSPGPKEASPKKCAGWPKGTVLERAIHDLERGVAEAFPLTGDRQAAIERAEAGGKSKRLPREVKQKLAKVARLSAKKGKIADDLVDRLMNIIGHVMRLKTLKRNLKSMVEMGLNAKQEKDVRLQDMKREVTELVKSRVSTFLASGAEQREGSLGQAPSSAGKVGGRFKWDQATEDRICDLYDHYVEGMDEHKGPQIRKLYIELAELWPDGCMDNHGIKAAVIRAKDRRKKQNKIKMGEEKRRKKAALATDRQKLDRESLLTEKRHLTPTASSHVPPAMKTVLPGKEKLIIKSTKQRVDETTKHPDGRIKRTDEGQMKHVEEARRIAVEAASRHHVESTRKHLADSSAPRENGITTSNLAKVKSILKTDNPVKVKKLEDGDKVKRKLPRKSFEGKIVEHVVKKKPRNESVGKDIIETSRKSNVLNSPLLKIKKKKPKITSESKPYPSLRVSPSRTASQSKADRSVNGHSLHSMQSSVRLSEPERVRDVARWSTEAARLMND